MTTDIQETLLQIFEHVRHEPEIVPVVPMDGWQEGSAEWQLLASFRGMVEQVQQRTLHLMQAEQQLREKEEQYRSIFEATGDALTVYDLDGFIVEANPAACSVYGCAYEELIGLHGSVLTHPDNLPMIAEAFQTVQTGRQYHSQGVGLRRDGTTFYGEGHTTPFIYKGKPHMLVVVRDITERMQAEEQLREREEQYRSIFEASSDALIIGDLENGHVVEANSAACRMYGYLYEEFIGQSAATLTHSEYHHLIAEGIQTIQANGQVDVQSVSMRKGGMPFPTETHTTTFTFKGQPHFLAVVRDITERVEAEKQLREKEGQYRSIFEATTDSLTIARLEDGQIVEANPAACKMLGYSYEEIIGLSPADLVPPDYLPVVAEGLQTLLAGGRNDIVMVALRKDGTLIPDEVHSTQFIYKGQPHLLTVSRDITERVQAEQQLREREEQYRAIFEATSDALLIGDLGDGHIVDANPAACRMYGYAYEEFIGLPGTTNIHPDYLHLLAEGLQTIQVGGRYSAQSVSLRKDRTAFSMEAYATPFIYKGKPHLLAAVRDITERVQAEQQLREKEEQYRSIFEETFDGLNINTLDGSFVEVNPALCKMYGYTREELLNISPTALIHPDSLHVASEALESIKEGKQSLARAVCLRKDGSSFLIESHVTPFMYKGQPHLLSVTHDITEQVQAQQLLEQRVEERTREISSLLEISHMVASTLQLKPLLGLILDQLKAVVDYSGASILTVEGEDLVYLDNRSPIPEEQLMQLRFPLKNLGLIWETLASRESIIMQDVRDESSLAQTLRVAMGELMETTFHYVRACLYVPLTLKDLVMGMLVLTSNEEGAFTPHHATLALAIANQAAVAIENARLYEQAQELAATQERQRLARELHDSVSQALYGIALGTHTARTLLDRDPSKVAEPLEYVISLAEAGLAEMRALIFELRPESLENEGLVSALTKQGAAMQARHGITVQTDLSVEPALSLTVKQELYRIAQEALYNTVKHAHASKVDLRLEQTGDAVMLEVRDDGAGFDTTASFPGHLGLHSMRERITNLGGTFEIESTLGAGTRICVRVPVVPRLNI